MILTTFYQTNSLVTRSTANSGRRAGLNYNQLSEAVSSHVSIERNLHADALVTLTLPPRRLQRAMSVQILPLINDEQVVQPLRRMSVSILQPPTPSSLNEIVSEINKPNETFEQESNSAISQKILDQNAIESEQVVVTEDRNANQFDVPEPMDIGIDDKDSLITDTKIEKSIGCENETLNLSIDISEPMDIDEEVKVINALYRPI